MEKKYREVIDGLKRNDECESHQSIINMLISGIALELPISNIRGQTCLPRESMTERQARTNENIWQDVVFSHLYGQQGCYPN